jgi:hypothetical protein
MSENPTLAISWPAKARRWVLAIFVLNALGVLAELLLLEHYESLLQQSPLYFMLLCSLALGIATLVRQNWALRFAQVSMAMTALLGMAGVYFHISENAEFELEMYPKMAGTELLWESLKGATPALAPGAITGLALLGLLYLWLLRLPAK